MAGRRDSDFLRKRRARNWAILAILAALSALFYVLTIVRMGGG